MEDKIILKKDAPVKFETRKLTGWFSENHFYGINKEKDEDNARYCECTHYECDKCGSVYKKNSYCKRCSEAKREEVFYSLEEVKYNGGPFFIYQSDKIFNSEEEYYDNIEYDSIKDFDKLVLAEEGDYLEKGAINDFLENYFSDLNIDDFEGLGPKQETQKMIQSLEDAIRKEIGTVYYPTKLRFKL